MPSRSPRPSRMPACCLQDPDQFNSPSCISSRRVGADLQPRDRRFAALTIRELLLDKVDRLLIGDRARAMVEIAIASLPHIRANLNYVAATSEKLVSYAYEPPPGVPLSTVQVEGHPTTIHDLRPAASEFALDEVGF